MTRKVLREQYKARDQVGGVFAIKNALMDKWLVDSAANIKAMENRFAFMGDSFGKLAVDYKAQQGEGFSFEVLEELKKGDAQTDKEFADDLAVLKSMWLDKLVGQNLY